jgi:transposase-like protein
LHPNTLLMFSYKIDTLLDEQKCYDHLVSLLHQGTIGCPHCQSHQKAVHSYQRLPVLTYRCRACGKFFNLFTRTVFQGTHYPCSVVVLLLRGVAQGVSTLQLSQELDIDYSNLLKLRHQLQENAYTNLEDSALPDSTTETDEMFQNAGEKGKPHPLPSDPPRRRANKKKAMALMTTIDLPSSGR